MVANPNEREVARTLGFGRPRTRLPMEAENGDRPVVDKLGIRSGMRVAFIGVADEDLAALVAARTPLVSTLLPRTPVEMVLFGAESEFALKRLRDIAPLVATEGSLWVLWPRGAEHLGHTHVRQAGLAAGLVDVKAARVTERLSGLKFARSLRER